MPTLSVASSIAPHCSAQACPQTTSRPAAQNRTTGRQGRGRQTMQCERRFFKAAEITQMQRGCRSGGAEFSVARLRSEGKEWGAARSASAPVFRRLRYEHKRVEESSVPPRVPAIPAGTRRWTGSARPCRREGPRSSCPRSRASWPARWLPRSQRPRRCPRARPRSGPRAARW